MAHCDKATTVSTCVLLNPCHKADPSNILLSCISCLFHTILATLCRFQKHIQGKCLDMVLLLLTILSFMAFVMELILIFGIHIMITSFRYNNIHRIYFITIYFISLDSVKCESSVLVFLWILPAQSFVSFYFRSIILLRMLLKVRILQKGHCRRNLDYIKLMPL
jgi:hypothetical protein